MSDTVVSSTGAPRGTMLSPVLLTVYTSNFQYISVQLWTLPHAEILGQHCSSWLYQEWIGGGVEEPG